MTSLVFSDDKVPSTVDNNQDTAAAAGFDPENPEEQPLVIEAPAEDASMLTKAGYYYAVTRQSISNKTKNLRPWKEFVDRDEFALPSKLSALANVSHNLTYFAGNYSLIALVLIIYTALTNIVLTLGMTCCFALYTYVKSRANAGEMVRIGQKEISPTAAYAVVVALSVLTFYLANGGSSIFYLVTVTGLIVLGHAACRKPVEAGANVNPAFSFA